MEIINLIFAPINLPFTILLIFVLGYWGLVILGALDMEALDIDVDADADVGLEIDADADADISDLGDHGSALGGVIQSMLTFANANTVPLMIVLSFFTLFLWMMTMLTTIHLNPGHSVLLALALFIPNYIVAILLTKIATMPLVKLFKKLMVEEEESKNVIGRTCRILSPATAERLGQAEVETRGATLLLNVKTRDGVTAEKGTEAAIVDFNVDRHFYIVEPITQGVLEPAQNS